MSAIPAVIAVLLADPAVAALAGPRVYAVTAPQGATMPSAVVVGLSEREDYTMAGANGLPEARVTVLCRGKSATDAIRLGDAVVAALRNVNGPVTAGGTTRTVTVFRDEVDSTDYVDEAQAYRRIVGFRVRRRL